MMNDLKTMNRAVDNIKIFAVSMVEKASLGHPGDAMGGADFINVPFSEYLVHSPDGATWIGRDRFYLDPGHMSPMLYVTPALQGKYTIGELKNFRQWDSPTTGHPERDITRRVENTSGPLGQGHTFVAGAAVVEKFLEAKPGKTMMQHKIYAYISGGGIQEEVSQGIGRLAGMLGLNNLIIFYDSSDVQLSTDCNAVTQEDTVTKYQSWGWNVLTINGNDVTEVRQALDVALTEQYRPTLIIGKTTVGKGALEANGSSYECNAKTYGASLGGDVYTRTVLNLGRNLDDSFETFQEVQVMCDKRQDELREIVAQRHAEEKAWAEKNPELSVQIQDWPSDNAPRTDWSKAEQKPGQATHAVSSVCFSVLAGQVSNTVCSSADPSNSDKADGFLRKTQSMVRGNFTGAFFQTGVNELTVTCMCIGMYPYGDAIPTRGTFLAFFGYQKPAVHLVALMEVPVKFIWSHDALRVGEGGPTHEPVEQEAQIRLMEKLKNHHGKDSARAFRLADVEETTVCWQMAMENTDTPTAFTLSRQATESLPKGNNYQEVRRGAYIVAGSDEQYDVILLASGLEVSTLVAGAKLLRNDNIKTRTVSVPSEGSFYRQSREYQEPILPKDVKIFGLIAGLPVTLQGPVGANGRVSGLESFGCSAPYKVSDEKLGFTAENVYKQVKEYLSE